MKFEIYKYAEWVLSIDKGSEIFHRNTLDEILEIVREKCENEG